MKAWYCPTWNGDVRIEPSTDDPKEKSVVSIVKPTASEIAAMAQCLSRFKNEGWMKDRSPIDPIEDGERITLNAPIEKVGPAVIVHVQPGAATLTVLKLKDGKIEICDHNEAMAGAATKEEAAAKVETALVETAKEAKPSKTEAAATVKRPTPSCPDCYVGEVNKPATQSLLAFLSAEQHKTWKKARYVVVRGGLSHHEYIVAHRRSEIATKNGRICWDATDKDTMHFHDQSVPPEEEVLAAMLILQHREDWLRNEATCLGLRFSRVFKNPFGDHNDGIMDAAFTRAVGKFAGWVHGVDLPLWGTSR
jgi:hypothetical protein